MLSVHSVLLKLLNVLPVLQRQTDLKNRTLNSVRTLFNLMINIPCKRVTDLLRWRSNLTLIQAVQQIKTSDSDLEAERRQEESAGGVQDQLTERSLLTPLSAADKTPTCDTLH